MFSLSVEVTTKNKFSTWKVCFLGLLHMAQKCREADTWAFVFGAFAFWGLDTIFPHLYGNTISVVIIAMYSMHYCNIFMWKISVNLKPEDPRPRRTCHQKTQNHQETWRRGGWWRRALGFTRSTSLSFWSRFIMILGFWVKW